MWLAVEVDCTDLGSWFGGQDVSEFWGFGDFGCMVDYDN